MTLTGNILIFGERKNACQCTPFGVPRVYNRIKN